MLWCALYLNDSMVGHLSAQRTRGGNEPDDVSLFAATVTTGGNTWHGNVEHRCGDGAWELMRAVLEAARDPGAP